MGLARGMTPPKDETVYDMFREFAGTLDRDSYLGARDTLIDSDSYEPYSRDLNDIKDLVSGGNIEAALAKLRGAMPNLILSPSAYSILYVIAKVLNDEKLVEMAQHCAITCMRGILSTGDGSEESPYLVVRISDVKDVLDCLSKELSSLQGTAAHQQRGPALRHDGMHRQFSSVV